MIQTLVGFSGRLTTGQRAAVLDLCRSSAAAMDQVLRRAENRNGHFVVVLMPELSSGADGVGGGGGGGGGGVGR